MQCDHPQVPPLLITAEDARRLEALLQSPAAAASPGARLLEAELLRAQEVAAEQIPPHVVTMHSRVRCIEEPAGTMHDVELVYPQEADAGAGRISILAPVGSALLGLSEGHAIDWPLPGGRHTRVRVAQVTFQPEAAARQAKSAG